jgi:uncharacterized protein (TIGR02246 family)
MKTILASILLLFVMQHTALAQETANSEMTDKSAIEKLIMSFPQALKGADISKVLPLFTADAVVMPNNAPTMKGSQQIKGLFENVFKKMSFDIQYIVDEVVINGDYAVVRTHSTGNNVVRASGENMPVNNKELFVVHRDNGEWRITHYMGNHN